IRITSSRDMPSLTRSNRSRVTRGPLTITSQAAKQASTAEASNRPQRTRRRVMAVHCRCRLRTGQAGVRFPAAKSVGASDNEAMAMNEQEWLVCDKPNPMLSFLRGKMSDRKLRLFACACCRRIWNLLSDDRSKRAVEIAELLVDGLVTMKELDKART